MNVVIYYGSQSGTASNFAKNFAKRTSSDQLAVSVFGLEDFQLETFQNTSIVIFIVATYGSGGPTDNAKDFYNWLQREKPRSRFKIFQKKKLAQMNYCVFGLGNEVYGSTYNRMAKFVDQKLTKLGFIYPCCGIKTLTTIIGAKRFQKIALGNASGDIEMDFMEWEKATRPLLSSISNKLSIVNKNATIIPQVLNPEVVPFKCTFIKKGAVKTNLLIDSEIEPLNKCFFDKSSLAKIDKVEALLADSSDGLSTLHVELSSVNLPFAYMAADNIKIYPHNRETLVIEAAQLLEYNLDDIFFIEKLSPSFKHPFPTPCTIRKALTEYIELSAPLTRELLQSLSKYAASVDERKRMEYLVSPNGSDDFKHTISNECLSLLDAYKLFSLNSIPLVEFITLIPIIKPRYYTISSSPLVYPEQIHLTISLVSFRSGGSSKFGCFSSMCHNHFIYSKTHTPFHVEVVPSKFRLPQNKLSPTMFISAGSGIAPMRALLQERLYYSIGNNVMFFGCRSAKHVLYKDELELCQKENICINYIAFSREGSQKYVQDLLLDNADVVLDVFTKSGYIYVCGKAEMASEIREKLKFILNEQQYDRLLKDERYVEEAWG